MARSKDFAAMERRNTGDPDGARSALRSRFAAPTSLRLEELTANPLNPRYGTEDPEVAGLAQSLSTVGQLQPALVVARDTYLSAYPDQAANLGPAPWVVVVGNRRLAAARLGGREALDVRVVTTLGTAEALDDAILIENIQRQDLPPLLEAERLKARLDRPRETTRSVASAIGKSHMYVQQRVDLLKLIPELQAALSRGELNLKTGRALAVLDTAEQRRALDSGPPYELSREPRQQPHLKAGDSVNPVSKPSSAAGSTRKRPASAGPTEVVRLLVAATSEIDRVGVDDPTYGAAQDARGHVEAALDALKRGESRCAQSPSTTLDWHPKR